MRGIRPLLVWLHRWVGLAMTLFLFIEGVTGAILAFEGPIGAWIDPPPVIPAAERALPPLDLATLVTLVEQREPRLQGAYFHAHGPDVAELRVLPRIDPATHKPYPVDVTHVVLDARTGAELARMPEHGMQHPLRARVMPFVRDLHYNLAIGAAGVWILFFMALAWTLDCFVSFLLTLPVALARFFSRWKPAWLVRVSAGTYRLNFDLHRAGGLWLWAAWFVFAWSSVQLEQQWGVYDTVMATIFQFEGSAATYARWPRHDQEVPLKLDWVAAQDRGRELMAEEARRQGFAILEPTNLVRFADNGIYNYSVRTDRVLPYYTEETVFFDGDSGQKVELPGIGNSKTGDLVSDWMRGLHMARDPIDYFWYHGVVCVAGVLLSVLCATGIVIWLKKRRARAAEAAQRARARGVAHADAVR